MNHREETASNRSVQGCSPSPAQSLTLVDVYEQPVLQISVVKDVVQREGATVAVLTVCTNKTRETRRSRQTSHPQITKRLTGFEKSVLSRKPMISSAGLRTMIL